jgi:uridine phosphorylase
VAGCRSWDQKNDVNAAYPILEFDSEREAIIEPTKVIKPVSGIPERCVLVLYHVVIESLRKQDRLILATNLHTSMGPVPVYRMPFESEEITVVHPGLGAPLAAGMVEELIASGCRKFIACGSAGVLDRALVKGTAVVPDSAVRDEGTSYHYVAPKREIEVEPDIVRLIENVLVAHGVKYQVGKTWTTDAFYSETKSRIAKRKAEGCLIVEMECAAFLAVAAFRHVRFAQLLGVEDDVSGSEWDSRHAEEHKLFPERLFWLSVEACMKL